MIARHLSFKSWLQFRKDVDESEKNSVGTADNMSLIKYWRKMYKELMHLIHVFSVFYFFMTSNYYK